MKKRYVYSMGAVVLLGCCMPALALSVSGGDSDRDYALGFSYMAGGYSVATGATANYVNNGWNTGAGVQWRLGPGPVSLRLDFAASNNNATSQLLSEGAAANQTRIDHGGSLLLSNDLDAVFDLPLSPGIKAYLLGGGGGAIRRIELTQTVTAGGKYCNDWAGFCASGSNPGDVLVDSKTTGRWEWNAGVGLRFSTRGRDFLFIEARYIEMQTPVPTSFIPIRVGVIL